MKAYRLSIKDEDDAGSAIVFANTAKEAKKQVFSHEQIEEKLIGFAEVVKGWQKESPQLYDEALDEILAVFKGLPAMQEEKYNDIERDYAVAYGGNYSDGNKKKWRNDLRNEILAELEVAR